MALKLGSGTGSLVNHILSREVIGQPEPTVGMGATVLHWSDREPATIVAVEKTKSGAWLITIQADDAKRTDKNGFSETQDYDYTPNPSAPKELWRFDPGKGWRSVMRNEKGRLVLTGAGGGLRIGEREKYHDFSF